MKIGFTGTREGMTVKQFLRVGDWMRPDMGGPESVEELHHGCCVGADAEFHTAVIRNRIGSGEFCWGPVHAHPCDYAGMVDQGSLALADEVHPVKPAMARNKDIVDACDVLLACPKGPEELRSGTWSTVRYARKCGKRIVIFWPDGSVTEG